MSLGRRFGAYMAADTFNAFDGVYLYYLIVKRLLIPVLQIRVRNVNLFVLFVNQNICCGN